MIAVGALICFMVLCTYVGVSLNRLLGNRTQRIIVTAIGMPGGDVLALAEDGTTEVWASDGSRPTRRAVYDEWVVPHDAALVKVQKPRGTSIGPIDLIGNVNRPSLRLLGEAVFRQGVGWKDDRSLMHMLFSRNGVQCTAYGDRIEVGSHVLALRPKRFDGLPRLASPSGHLVFLEAASEEGVFAYSTITGKLLARFSGVAWGYSIAFDNYWWIDANGNLRLGETRAYVTEPRMRPYSLAVYACDDELRHLYCFVPWTQQVYVYRLVYVDGSSNR